MKKPEECSDRELLVRIDERTHGLREKVDKHSIIIAVMAVVLIAMARGLPWVAEVLAK